MSKKQLLQPEKLIEFKEAINVQINVLMNLLNTDVLKDILKDPRYGADYSFILMDAYKYINEYSACLNELFKYAIKEEGENDD